MPEPRYGRNVQSVAVSETLHDGEPPMFPPDFELFLRMVVIAGFACWAAQIAGKALVAWI